MEKIAALYRQHLTILQQRVASLLAMHQLDGLLIHSGEPLLAFMDDHQYPFRVNPHFKAWLPLNLPHCWLWVDGINRPKLYFYAPVDYWHCVESLPDVFWTAAFDITLISHSDEIAHYLPVNQYVAYIGDSLQRALGLGVTAHNPQALIDYLHYYRAHKTEYEVVCLREAQKIAINGHREAKEAFFAGMSEYDINMAYLSATGQRDTDVPYGNIVTNHHAAVLHYNKLATAPPDKMGSFLLDAGAEYHGYAADITRTYAAKEEGHFAALIEGLDEQQRGLMTTIKSGVRFTEYHLQMHQRIAGLLKAQRLILNLSEEAIVELGISALFFPHGLGHFLGLQVHDVAGFMQNPQGENLAAPKAHPSLRCTRILEVGMVLTIEPGIYFIESLLASWRIGELRGHFNWPIIDGLKPFGGVRIEDNIVIHEKRIENMTRDAFLAR